MPYYHAALNNQNLKINFKDNNINNKNNIKNINNTKNYYMNTQSENNLIDDGTLNPMQDLLKKYKK